MVQERHYAIMKDGTKIYYETCGSGPTLVFLHGNGSNGRFFSYQVPFFGKNHRLIIVDSRGHGHSTNNAKALSFRLMADDLFTVLKQEQVTICDIVGFSDGANLAMKFATMHPEMVHRLVLNAGNTNVSGEKLLSRAATRIWYGWTWLLSYFVPGYKAKLKIIGLMLKDIGVSKEELQQIKAPSLVIVGSHDLIKVRHSQWIAKNIPRSVFKQVSGQGHLLARRVPLVFNQEVAAFLDVPFPIFEDHLC